MIFPDLDRHSLVRSENELMNRILQECDLVKLIYFRKMGPASIVLAARYYHNLLYIQVFMCILGLAGEHNHSCCKLFGDKYLG